MSKEIPGRNPPEIVELVCSRKGCRQFRVTGGDTDNDAMDAVAQIFPEGTLHPRDKTMESCFPSNAIVQGTHRMWLVDVNYRPLPGAGENSPEPVERRPEPTPRPRSGFPMFRVHCAKCERPIKIPYMGNPDDRDDIVVPFLCTVCRKTRRKPTTPTPPLTPEQKAMLAIGEYPMCPVCWAEGTKERLLASCSEGRCSESLRACAIREIQMQLRALAIRGRELLVDNNALRQDDVDVRVAVSQIVATLERIPCMSEDCEGIEDGLPAFKHRPVTVRCHRCEAVRLGKSVM